MNAADQRGKDDVACDLFLSDDHVLTVHVDPHDHGFAPTAETVERLHALVTGLARAVRPATQAATADEWSPGVWGETSDALASAVTMLTQLADACVQALRAPAASTSGVPEAQS